MKRIILASQSPRRKDLLSKMGVKFEVIPSSFDERLDDSREPTDVAIELGLGKAEEIAAQYPDAIVIGSDTIVCLDGKQLAKPEDIDEAKSMLTMLAGKDNQVITSAVVVCRSKDIRLTAADVSTVRFKPYNEQLIDQYVATGDPLDKAGAYGIQSGAATLILGIDGDYDTIVGLPTRLLQKLLSKVDIDSKVVELTPPVKTIKINKV